MGPPCVLRAGRITPHLHGGRALLRRARVAELPRRRAPDLRSRPAHAVRLGPRARGPGARCARRTSSALTRDAVLCRGLGRSYGDSSLPPPSHPVVAGTRLADRILAFDADTGVLRAEAGFSLRELNRLFLPRGFFAPVTPGTQFVTLGGMVAADVHGKNHHRDGCFGAPRRARCACAWPTAASWSARPTTSAELFRATVGGHGPHRPHPRGGVPAGPRPVALDLASRASASATSTRSSTALKAAAAALADTRWAGSTACRAGKAMGRGILHQGALGRARGGAGPTRDLVGELGRGRPPQGVDVARRHLRHGGEHTSGLLCICPAGGRADDDSIRGH